MASILKPHQWKALSDELLEVQRPNEGLDMRLFRAFGGEMTGKYFYQPYDLQTRWTAPAPYTSSQDCAFNLFYYFFPDWHLSINMNEDVVTICGWRIGEMSGCSPRAQVNSLKGFNCALMSVACQGMIGK